MKNILIAGFVCALPALASAPAFAGLVNPGFEYGVAAGGLGDVNDASIDPSGGWFTTESDHVIEVWGTGKNGVAAFEGSNFVELNANAVGTLYQDTSGIAAGNTVGYQFAHRGRGGVDVMQLDITDITTNQILFSQQYSDGNAAWGFYTGQFLVGAGVASTDTIRFAYESISAAGGNPTVGNFLDDANFGIGIGGDVPEPATLSLLGAGLLGFRALRRRRKA